MKAAAGGALAVLCAATAAWVGYRLHSPVPAPAALATPAGQASPPIPSDAAGPEPQPGLREDLAIPERLPDLSLPDVHGVPTPLSAWRGKALVLNFWATWCAPCRREIPLLEQTSREWGPKGVQVVGIAVDRREAVLPFAAAYKIDYPLLVGEDEALQAAARLGVSEPLFPFSVFTDAAGDLVALFVGELHPPQLALILGVVQRLDAGTLRLEAAKDDISAGLRQIAP